MSLWISPSNASADDGVSAVNSLGSGDQTCYLVARNFDFSSIPSDATIDSIVVNLKRDGSSGNVKDVVVKLWQAGAVGDNHADTASYWGGPGESIGYSGWGTWGLTLTPYDVQQVDFGCCISVENDTGGALPAVDVISMEIVYTPAVADSPPSALDHSNGLFAERRSLVRRAAWMPSIGADDALNFADQPSEMPLTSPGALDLRSRVRLRSRPSFVEGFADNLTDELASVDSSSTLLFAPAVGSRRPQIRRLSAVVTNSPPPDEVHSCGCVGTAEIVSYGFATAEFVGSASDQNGGGGFTAEVVESGYTAEIIDACDCEE